MIAHWQDPDEAADAKYDATLLPSRDATPRSEFPPALLEASRLAEALQERDRAWRARDERVGS